MTSANLLPHPMYAHLSKPPPPPVPKVEERLEDSRRILEEAFSLYDPYATVSMISGGKDSICAYYVMKKLNYPVTHILHGVTGTGIEETTQFVRDFAAQQDISYIEANAAQKYEEYVLRKGFFGIGGFAHQFSYHLLKSRPFGTAISSIRQRKKGRDIFMINGARFWESSRRGGNNNIRHYIREDKRNIWVNILQDWRRIDRDTFLEQEGAAVNPVTTTLCRSGECMCGTMQSQADREEAAYFFPKWGNWLTELEREVCKKFPWKWGEARPNPHISSSKETAIPLMCIDCAVTEEPS